MTAEHDDYRHLLGAYVLGGITPADRAVVDTHIATCPTCRAELADFAVIPSLLAKTAAPEPDPSPEPDRTAVPQDRIAPHETPALHEALRTVAAVRGAQRRRRRSATAVLAAAALATGIGVGSALAPDPVAPGPAPIAAQRSITLAAPAGTSTGSVDLAPKPWGTELHLTLHDLPTGTRLTAIVIGTDGHTESAATWTTPAQPQIKVTGATSFRPETVQRIEIRSESGTPIATS
ncbi:anti-sigma factor family protein [Nocardia yamanashiensis]|uniref:anti-sigma factor family protein n=1 Tax=Nocardia yamanashiensis TaxID=209247 RepID=UPI00082950CF|nr:zf-HC2 domain-containing protein [Nocardia yamanashiensis]